VGARYSNDGVPAAHRALALAGALAACLVGVSEYFRYSGELSRVTLVALDFEVIVGGLTFTGSLMAAGKLQELLPGRPITYRGAEHHQPHAAWRDPGLGRCTCRHRVATSAFY
jgi:NAD/NADP transhydrogenase beta subunit